MELKINYQYTYFIYPFIIKEKKYKNYLLKMLKDKNCHLKRFEKEKDLQLYKYFLPKTREFLFSTFSFTASKLKKLEELPQETKAAILSKYPCNLFEYQPKKEIQGKVQEEKGIFFTIPKIEIVCFHTGICFLCMKTTLEGTLEFSNILNFNYKFKSINQEATVLNHLDKIQIQTDSFENIGEIKDFIKKITGSNVEAVKLDLDTQRFLTYSYVCVDQSEWNSKKPFEKIEHNFIKLANQLPADDSRNLNEEELATFSSLKYTQIGMTKRGVTLFASSTDMNNYTFLPDKYENQYFYTYLLNMYKKICLKQLENKLKQTSKLKRARKEFVEFTKKIWIQEVTEDKTGTLLNLKLQDTLELDKLYAQIKNKYDIYYKERNIERNVRYTIMVAIMLVALLMVNLVNLFLIMKK